MVRRHAAKAYQPAHCCCRCCCCTISSAQHHPKAHRHHQCCRWGELKHTRRLQPPENRRTV